MTFNVENLTRITSGVNPKGNVWYSYEDTQTDDLATIKGDGYFNEKINQFEVGDVIHVQATDDYQLIRVNGVTTNITVESYISLNLASGISGILPIANGGTNSDATFDNDRVMISSGGSIIESPTITITELGLLDGILSVSTGSADNDKFVTQGYVDDSFTGSGYWKRVVDVVSPLTGTDSVQMLDLEITNYPTINGTALTDQYLATTNNVTFTNLEITNMPTVSGTSINTNGVLDLTSNEVLQLANIDATTITNGQWGYLGLLDQGVATTDSPIFSGMTIGVGAVGVDYTLTFDGETNNGVLTYMEDENVFSFGSGIRSDLYMGVGIDPGVPIHVSKYVGDGGKIAKLLNPTMGSGNNMYFQFGRSDSVGNAIHIGFEYVGDNSSSNGLTLGFESNPIIYTYNSGRVGFKNSTPKSYVDFGFSISKAEWVPDPTDVVAIDITHYCMGRSKTLSYPGITRWNLPTADDATLGREYKIFNPSTGVMDVYGSTTDDNNDINGTYDYIQLTQDDCVTVMCVNDSTYATNRYYWAVVGGNGYVLSSV